MKRWKAKKGEISFDGNPLDLTRDAAVVVDLLNLLFEILEAFKKEVAADRKARLGSRDLDPFRGFAPKKAPGRLSRRKASRRGGSR